MNGIIIIAVMGSVIIGLMLLLAWIESRLKKRDQEKAERDEYDAQPADNPKKEGD